MNILSKKKYTFILICMGGMTYSNHKYHETTEMHRFKISSTKTDSYKHTYFFDGKLWIQTRTVVESGWMLQLYNVVALELSVDVWRWFMVIW